MTFIGRRPSLTLLLLTLTACTVQRPALQQHAKETSDMKDRSDARLKELTAKLRELYDDKKVKATFTQIFVPPSTKGATARGVIIDEGKGELDLDIHPCTGQIATFHEPYVKETRVK